MRPGFFLLTVFFVFVLSARGADDSRPQLLSTTGGHGGGWPSISALEKAAAAGDARACADLGDMLATGTGMTADLRRAVPLLERAAAAGEPAAAFRLGKLFETGEGVPRDLTRSLNYYRAAAEGGVPEAYYNLGAAYASARGVKRDFVEGLAWMILATQSGAPADGENAVREQLKKIRRPELITQGEARAKVLAAELEKTAAAREAAAPADSAKQGSQKKPRYRPGTALPTPRPALVPVPLPSGAASAETEESGPPVKLVGIFGQRYEWSSFGALQRGADRGEADALYALGFLLIEGDKLPSDVTADVDRGLMLLERAAAAGSVDAAFRLAELYTTGRKGPKDDNRAFQYTLQAARAGARSAITNLGAFYANGRGTKRDYTEALAWLITAEHFGAPPALAAKIRSYLSNSAPEQIPIAERRAEELKRAIEEARGGSAAGK